MKTRARNEAVTLFELIVTVTVLTALSTVGISTYSSSLSNRRADVTAKKIAADIRLVQQAAITAQADRTIVFTITTNSYAAPQVADPQRPTRRLAVDVAAAPFHCLLAEATFGLTAKLTFDGRGQPADGGTIRVESGGRARTIAVDADTGTVEVQP